MIGADLNGLLHGGASDAPIAKVVGALSGHGAVSTAQIVRSTGLARSTVSTILSDLKRSNLVVEVDARNAGPGRPAIAHSLNPEAGTCVGALLAEDAIRVLVADVAHNVLGDLSMPLEKGYSAVRAGRVVKHTVDALFKEHSLVQANLLGFGFAVTGTLAPDGRVLRSTSLRGWDGADFRGAFEPLLQKPIFADSEGNCAALAEMMWGAAAGCSNFALVRIDQRVTGSLVVGGRPLVGGSGSAGEIGHMVIDPSGPLCRCGNRGCLELYCSARHVERMAADLFGGSIAAPEIVFRAIEGDIGFRRVIADAGEIIGRGLSIVGALANPPMFIVSGLLAAAGDLLLAPIKSGYAKHALVKPDDVDPSLFPQFRIGRFLENDSCLGAAGLVLRRSGRLSQERA